MSKKLFIPGPIDVSEDVLEKMATPVISHRSKEASELQKSITEKAKKLFYTDNEILLSTSSGTGLMEGSIRCCTAKRAAVFSCGSFGDRWHKMGITNGVPTDLFKVELGQAIEPEMVDKVLATGKYDLITVTHNETSTGIRNPIEDIGQILKNYDDIVYCVDTVSSAGGIKIPVDEIGIDICIHQFKKQLAYHLVCRFVHFPKNLEKEPKKYQIEEFILIYYQCMSISKRKIINTRQLHPFHTCSL